MFRDQYKKDFDTVIPDAEQIRELSQKLHHEPARPTHKGKNFGIAAALTASLLVGSLVLGDFCPPFGPQNSFTVVAYPADKEEEKTLLTAGMKVELPVGTISRGEAWPEESEQKGYNSCFEGTSSISVIGDNIESVSYSCLTEELHYRDRIMKKQMQQNGELVFCEFAIKQSLIPDADRQKFKRLWNEGYFEDIKQQYFQNRSTNIDDYRITFRQSGEQIPKGEWTIAIEPDYQGKYPFEERGKQVTAKYYEELGNESFEVHWSPGKALDLVSEYKPIDLAQLPGDTIIITANFTDGRTMTKILKLSFDEQGQLMAQLLE